MRNKSLSFLTGVTLVICMVMLLPFVSGYVYPGPREKVNGLGEWSWVVYVLSACLFALGAASLKINRPGLSGIVAGFSLFLGPTLIIIGIVKIPLGFLTITYSSSSSSGIVATQNYLNDPVMAPIGIALLILAALLLIFPRRLKKNPLQHTKSPAQQ